MAHPRPPNLYKGGQARRPSQFVSHLSKQLQHQLQMYTTNYEEQHHLDITRFDIGDTTDELKRESLEDLQWS